MVGRIEDYALIGDTHTAALVGKDGSIDWLCVPRFDSGAVFAALLGRPDDHGRWLLAPAGGIERVERQYRPNTFVLETTFHTDTAWCESSTACPSASAPSSSCGSSSACRVACRCRWTLASASTTAPRCRGSSSETVDCTPLPGRTPWCSRRRWRSRAPGTARWPTFVVEEGERVPFVLTWHPSHEPAPRPTDAERALRSTTTWWRRWSGAVPTTARPRPRRCGRSSR